MANRKVSSIQSLSFSVHGTPEKNGHPDAASRSPELLQEFLKLRPKKDLPRSFFGKQNRTSISSKSKMCENPKTTDKSVKKQDSKKSSASSQPSGRKQNRKSDNPIRLPPVPKHTLDYGSSNTWICKNSACRAILSIDDAFCKRCSCCICHLFDDNKDPSLWLECASELADGDFCGLSCHIECALQREKVGVVDLGQLMQLDGSYCCASCGKVSGILGFWKKQLVKAKAARRLDELCYRIYLSHRLLDGTSRFRELHQIVSDAKLKLEAEVGPVDGNSARMARGLVSRLSVAWHVHKFCTLAIEKADELLANASNGNLERRDSLPAACKFIFEEVKASSVVIILIECPSGMSKDLKGYKLWYYKSRDETPAKEPVCVFPRTQRRFRVTDLTPCTEYTFRIVSYSDAGDLGHSEVKCFTKSIELLKTNRGVKEMIHSGGSSSSAGKKLETNTPEESNEFRVRELGKVLQLAWAQEHGSFEGFCSIDSKKCCSEPDTRTVEHGTLPPVSKGIDLNIVSVPDLNEVLTPPFDSSRDEDNGTVNHDDDSASDDVEKNGLARSNGSGDSQTWSQGARTIELHRKRVNDEIHETDSTLVNGSDDSGGRFDESFESCVKTIRWLECQGHINQEFRLKLLTWFSLRSTEQERRVVSTFIQTLIDDPSSLAGQLVDTFSEIISSKRPRNGFCSKLWH